MSFGRASGGGSLSIGESSERDLIVCSRARTSARLPIPEFLPFQGSMPHPVPTRPRYSSAEIMLKWGSRFRNIFKLRERVLGSENERVKDDNERNRDDVRARGALTASFNGVEDETDCDAECNVEAVAIDDDADWGIA